MARTTTDTLANHSQAHMSRGRARAKYAAGVAESRGAVSKHGEIKDWELTDALSDQLGATITGQTARARDGHRDGESAGIDMTYAKPTAYSVIQDVRQRLDSAAMARHSAQQIVRARIAAALDRYRSESGPVETPDAWELDYENRKAIERCQADFDHWSWQWDSRYQERGAALTARIEERFGQLQHKKAIGDADRRNDADGEGRDGSSNAFYSAMLAETDHAREARAIRDAMLDDADTLSAAGARELHDKAHEIGQKAERQVDAGLGRLAAVEKGTVDASSGGSVAARIEALKRGKDRKAKRTDELDELSQHGRVYNLRDRFGG